MLTRIGAIVLAALVAASVLMFAWAPFATSHPKKVNAIVVLAGSKSRLPVALRLWHRGIARWLLVSMDSHDPRRVALCTDPPRHVVCFDAKPYSTRGEARWTTRFARHENWRSLAIVTSRFHLFRTRLLFRRCTGARIELVAAPVTWWRWPIAIATEWGKLIVAETARRSC